MFFRWRRIRVFHAGPDPGPLQPELHRMLPEHRGPGRPLRRFRRPRQVRGGRAERRVMRGGARNHATSTNSIESGRRR